MTDATPPVETVDNAVLAKAPLVLAAIGGTTVVADREFPPGANVSVGSNSKNDLVLPEKFELSKLALISGGAQLLVSPPLYIQATVWSGGAAVALSGFWRNLRKEHPELGEKLQLASPRFLVRYGKLALMGRYRLDESP